MLRKRQRQELSDAIAGEMDTHGVVSDDKDGDGESKTASFKKSNKKREGQGEGDATALAPLPASAAAKKKSKKSKKDKQDGAEAAVTAVTGGGDETAAGEEDGEGEKQGRKRKARRKKSKSAATEVVAEGAGAAAAAGAEAAPQTSAAIVEEQQSSVVVEAETADQGEPKKQRRGWGKARPKPAAASVPARGADQSSDAVEGERKVDERRPRKKTRSRQKNIRKDKRPMEKRPSYLRAGDPEFSGRGLTDETRKFLGLPADDFGDAPPAGWGKPGKMAATPVCLVDKKPRRLPEHLAAEGGDGSDDGGDDGGGGGGGGRVETVEAGADIGVAMEPTGQRAPSTAAGRKKAPAKKYKKSKYKNLA